MNKNKFSITTVFKAVGLAMGVSVAIISHMGTMDTNSMISMLGIGLACLGASALANNKDE